MIRVIYEDNHLLVVEKPINMLVQADSTNDFDLLSELKKYLKEKYNKPGNVYLGLVHRLDRPVGGIMVFAKTSKASARLSEDIRKNKFHKVYYAIVEGELEKYGIFEDKLLKNCKTNTVIVSNLGKESKLEYEVIGQINNKSLVRINLITGRSHQIRVQFSSRNHPLVGDHRYNKNVKEKEQICLFAKELSFVHPVTKEKMLFNIDLPKNYPWSLFDKN